MNWLIFALISVIALSISNVLQRVLMKDDKSDAFFCAAIISLFALWRGFIMPPITRLPLNFFLLTVLYGSGTVFIYDAFILKHRIDVYSYTAISFLLPGIFLLLINPRVVTKFGFLFKGKRPSVEKDIKCILNCYRGDTS